MDTWEPDEIDFEDQYIKADPIDDADLDTSMTILNESIREQEELEKRSINKWTSTNKDKWTKLEQRIAFNEKKQGLYIMTASKTILSILHRGVDKIKQDGKVMVLDGKSAEKLYSRLRLFESDKSTHKITFENESGTHKDIRSPGNRWLALMCIWESSVRNSWRILVLMQINLKVVQKVRFPKRKWNK